MWQILSNEDPRFINNIATCIYNQPSCLYYVWICEVNDAQFFLLPSTEWGIVITVKSIKYSILNICQNITVPFDSYVHYIDTEI